MTPDSLRLPGVLLILILIQPGCGSGDLLLPGGPTALTPVSGDGQSGVLGSRLPDPLVVEVSDEQGRRVAGATVDFVFAGDVPDGAVTPQTATTNEQGQASAEVQLGTVEGDQPVEARVAGDGDSTLRARFTLTALPRNDGGGGGGNGGGGGGNGGGGSAGGGGQDDHGDKEGHGQGHGDHGGGDGGGHGDH
ncbi:MAG: Ig-like domain-containing protein [Gemmatimonadales bacterium]